VKEFPTKDEADEHFSDTPSEECSGVNPLPLSLLAYTIVITLVR
jgi:hypothetical protein